MVCEYRLHPELFGDSYDVSHGMSVSGDQASVRIVGVFPPLLVQFNNGGMNERHASVLCRQSLQYVAVKHEATKHLVAMMHRHVQSGMVVQAQIPPEPDQYRCKMCEMSACHLHP